MTIHIGVSENKCIYPISKVFIAGPSVLLEPRRAEITSPAIQIFQILRQVPVIQGDGWLNAIVQELINEGIVVINSCLIHLSNA